MNFSSRISLTLPGQLSALVMLVCFGGALYKTTQQAELAVQVGNIRRMLNASPKDKLRYGALPVQPPPFPSSFPNEVCKAAETDFRSASGVFAIITGLEHSGTTITSSLVMSAPNLFGGFECGLLFAATPAEFQKVEPFYDWMLIPASQRMWGLTEQQREALLEHSCHAEQYHQIRQQSALYETPNDQSWIVDKTPFYIYELVEVMDRTPGVPVLVTQKNREEQLASFRRHGGESEETEKIFQRRTETAANQLAKALEKYPDRIHVINTTALALNPDPLMEAAFAFLGLQWKPEYKTLEDLKVKTNQAPLAIVGDGFHTRAGN